MNLYEFVSFVRYHPWLTLDHDRITSVAESMLEESLDIQPYSQYGDSFYTTVTVRYPELADDPDRQVQYYWWGLKRLTSMCNSYNSDESESKFKPKSVSNNVLFFSYSYMSSEKEIREYYHDYDPKHLNEIMSALKSGDPELSYNMFDDSFITKVRIYNDKNYHILRVS